MTPVVETNMSDNIGSGCAELEPYALRVTDDSMAPEFWEGCIIIIEPRHSAQSGQYAVVDYANDTTFRQFVEDVEVVRIARRVFGDIQHDATGKMTFLTPVSGEDG